MHFDPWRELQAETTLVWPRSCSAAERGNGPERSCATLRSMRWFTRETHTPEPPARVLVEYMKHLDSIKARLPAAFRVLSEAGGRVSLHDGRFIQVSKPFWEPAQLIFDIACWDRSGGTLRDDIWTYPDLHVRIVYGGAELVSPTWDELEKLAMSPATEIQAGEVDVAHDGRLEHRMLLRPEDAPLLAVRFSTADVIPVRFDGASMTVLRPPSD